MRFSSSRPRAGLAAFFFFFSLLASPVSNAAPAAIPMTPDAWRINAGEHRFEDYRGEKSLFLKDGAAEAVGAAIENGVIEFDIALENDRGFSGVAFRRAGPGEYEHFYLRPHQSGQPDASQYTPVFNGVSAWQILYGPRYAAPLVYRFDEWMHVKLVVQGDKADIYLDSDKPVLHVAKLMRHRQGGAVAINSFFAPAHFANLTIEERDDVAIVGEAPPLDPLQPGAVGDWEISTPFDSKSLEGVDRLTKKEMKSLQWAKLGAEENGVANIARVAGFGEGKDTVFARLVIDAPRREIRRLRFGFSDEAKAYVNGGIVYSGGDGYMSRDHRFLGTVGLYDALYLPLEKGRNEIIFAVKENFGGWAIAGALDDGDDQ